LAEFGLKLHPEKTRLIEFGRFAMQNAKTRGQGKPETFNFLGFTHCCGRTRKGKFTVIRQTMRQRLLKKLILILRCALAVDPRQEPNMGNLCVRIRAGGAE
jgi:hypothetical protein